MSLWRPVIHEARLLAVALQFLTRVPVPARVGFEPAWLNQCVRHFPAVGALVGLWGSLVMALASSWWPPVVAALCAVAATAWLTGAFHEDGLADTFDGLGGVVSREKALAIMKDSRIGTYGAVALVLALALRTALLAALLASGALAAGVALVASQVLGRAAAVSVMVLLPYAGDAEHAKAKPLATAVPRRVAVVAWGMAGVMLWGLAAGASAVSETLAGGLLPPGFSVVPLAAKPVEAASMDFGAVMAWRLALALAASLAVVAVMRRWLKRRLGGYTGDTLGATEQLTEVVVLAVFAAAWAP